MQSDSETNSRFASQLPRNLAANIAYFLVNIVIGLLLVPYFIDTLGIAAYGLIPLATSITGFVALVVQSINTSVSRFLTVDLGREDYVSANRTFNTALFGLTGIIILMIPAVIAVSYYVPVFFDVPAGQETGAVFLFFGVMASFLIRAWSGNFTVQLFAYNRLDLQNYVNITNIVVQVVIIIIFFGFFGPSLAAVGSAYLIGSVIASLISIYLARQVCPHIKVARHCFDRSRLRDIGGMGWWVVINDIGALLFLQIDLIVVNMLFGSTSTGEYAIALQWVILLRALAAVLAGVLTPMVLTYYAKKQTDTLISITKSAVKLMGLAMALPIGLICGLAPQLITVWVGQEYIFLAPLMVLLTIHLPINLAVLPLFPINIAYNRVRIPGIVTLIMGIGNVVLAIILPILLGWGIFGVAAAGAIVLTAKNAIFTPWYTKRILDSKRNIFSKSLLPGTVAAIIIGISAAILGFLLPLFSLISIITAGGVIVIVYFTFIWKFCLDNFERDLFTSYLPKRFK